MTNEWFCKLNSTTKILKTASTRDRILKIILDENYTGTRSGFVTRAIEHATLYTLKHCPVCSSLSKRLHHVAHVKPSSKEICSNRGPFKFVQGHKVSLSYIKILSSHEFPEISSPIVANLNKPQSTRELTEYILSGNKYLDDINFKESILDKYKDHFDLLRLEFSQESNVVQELRQAFIDRTIQIIEFARKEHKVGQSLFKKFRNVQRKTVILYTNLVFKILYTMIKLQELEYFKLEGIYDEIERIDSAEVIVNHFDTYILLKKINPIRFKFVCSPFIVELWINNLEHTNFSFRDESGIQH